MEGLGYFVGFSLLGLVILGCGIKGLVYRGSRFWVPLQVLYGFYKAITSIRVWGCDAKIQCLLGIGLCLGCGFYLWFWVLKVLGGVGLGAQALRFQA